MFQVKYISLTLSSPVGRNLPMAQKFRNSSNSAEFGALGKVSKKISGIFH